MTNSADPDQLVSWKSTDLDLHCLQRWGISSFGRIRIKLKVILMSADFASSKLKIE